MKYHTSVSVPWNLCFNGICTILHYPQGIYLNYWNILDADCIFFLSFCKIVYVYVYLQPCCLCADSAQRNTLYCCLLDLMLQFSSVSTLYTPFSLLNHNAFTTVVVSIFQECWSLFILFSENHAHPCINILVSFFKI